MIAIPQLLIEWNIEMVFKIETRESRGASYNADPDKSDELDASEESVSS